MSCPHRAWMESCARAVVDGAGKLGKRLLGTAHSFTRLRWLVAAAVLVLAFGPGVSLAHAATDSASGSAGPQLLAPGDGEHSPDGSGPVRALQRRLAGRGVASGPVDGRYGPLTGQAVTRFQAAHGLQVDGIAGPQTLAAVNAPIPVLYPGAGSEPGGSGPVRTLQRSLTEAGFAPGPIDGSYGPRTIEAVEHFQRANRLTVDGIAGPHTLQALRAARNRRAAIGHPRLPLAQPSVRHVHPVYPVSRPGSALAITDKRTPALPLTAVLLGFAVLGLATMSSSYARTRARVRRARATARASEAPASQGPPALTAGVNGVHATHAGSER